MDAEGSTPVSDQQLLIRTSYDAPWTTEGRRDEVMIRKMEEGEGQWRGPWISLSIDE